MNAFKIGWVALLTLFYAAFWLWYGGNGKPLTEAEGQALIEQIETLHRDAGRQVNISSFLANMDDMIAKDDGKEFYAINLETLKQGPEAEAADEAYARHVIPALIKRGSFPVYVGDRAGLMLGDYGNEIDRVAIVRYRSLRDLLDMNTDPAMIEGTPYKFDSLIHTEVFISRPSVSAVHVRLTLALLLILLGWLGIRLAGWIAHKRASVS